jgi:hypothetical protein
MMRTRFVYFEVAAFLVFISLGFWIGTNIGGANAAPINEQQVKATPSPLPSMPDGERIVLIAGTDNNNSSQPRLESLWLLTYYLDSQPIHFLPIYPSGRDTPTEFEKQLLDSFYLEYKNGISVVNSEFLSLLTENNYWLSGYILFDTYAAAQMINLIGGIPSDHGIYSGEQLLATIPTSFSQQHEAYPQQAILLGQTCLTLSQLSASPNWHAALTLFPEHIVTDLQPLGLITELNILSANPAQIRCEFPFLHANP